VSWYPPKPNRLPGSAPWRAAGKRPFGATWWGRAWVDALEQRARLDPNRLPRGRTYARTGAVDELEVRAGEIVAAVQGSRATPYRVTVRVRGFTDKEWERAVQALASQAGHLASLLDGEMPPSVADDLAGAGIDLLPVAGEVQPRCSCPDWADPCKHSAAVCYLVADTLDADPFLLFLMRGRDQETLLAALRATRAVALGGRASATPRRGEVLVGEVDRGVGAREAWDRWATLGQDAAPPLPVIPLPPAKPGRPTVLASDPPTGSGLTTTSLQRLAADAVRRAWEVANGERNAGLELTLGEDLARRAAATIGPSGGGGDLAELAQRAGMPARELVQQALAWRDGGGEGLFLLLDHWDPPSEEMAQGRASLGEGATIRRDRVTLGDRQLRYGRDGRWYPFRRSKPGSRAGAWTSDGTPFMI
jgi:uncharacterized Zn finger protein